jgi:hypothetical protein
MSPTHDSPLGAGLTPTRRLSTPVGLSLSIRKAMFVPRERIYNALRERIKHAFDFHFPATIAHGVFHGERGIRGEPAFYELNGSIQPDGTALLSASGITGKQEHNQGLVPPGVPYSYTVKALFKGSQAPETRSAPGSAPSISQKNSLCAPNPLRRPSERPKISGREITDDTAVMSNLDGGRQQTIHVNIEK